MNLLKEFNAVEEEIEKVLHENRFDSMPSNEKSKFFNYLKVYLTFFILFQNKIYKFLFFVFFHFSFFIFLF